MAQLGKAHIGIEQDHATVQLWVGELDGDTSHVLAINQAMPRHAIAAEPVALRLSAPKGMVAGMVTISRIDEQHANPAALWQSWDAPEYLSSDQVARLHAASAPVAEPLPFVVDGSLLVLETTLAPQSVNLVRITWIAG